MDDYNRNVQHPLLAALRIFDVAVRSAFDTAAAFWRPWSGKREKQEAPAQQQSNAPSEQAPQPIKRDQEATVKKKPKGAPTKRAQPPKPLAQGATVEKKAKGAPTKRALEQEQELERQERAQKTERLRKLRLAKEAADRERSALKGENH